MPAPTSDAQYVPGVCNIDAAGRRKRMLFGLVLLAITFAIWNYFRFVISAGPILKTTLFIPALLGFMGLWQAQLHFCTGNARKRQYEMGGAVGAVTDEESIRKDSQRAGQVFICATLCAIALTLVLMSL